MAKFASVSPRFWTDPMVRGWNDSQQKLALYLMTSPHRNLQGIYRLSMKYASDDLGWSERRTRETLRRLETDGFAEYDEKAMVVLLPNALRYYQPHTEPQVKGAIAALQQVPPTRLKKRFVALAKAHGADALHTALMNGSAVSHE